MVLSRGGMEPDTGVYRLPLAVWGMDSGCGTGAGEPGRRGCDGPVGDKGRRNHMGVAEGEEVGRLQACYEGRDGGTC